MPEQLSPQQVRNFLCLTAAVLFAITGTELAATTGYGAAGVLLLVTLAGTLCFAILSRRQMVIRSLVFGTALLIYNGARSSGNVCSFDYLQVAVPIFLVFPIFVALIARRLRR